MKKTLLLASLVAVSYCVSGQSFEGTLHTNQFIWLEFNGPTDSLINGSYFNKRLAGEIKFTGLRKRDTLQLQEKSANGGVAATFVLVDYKDSLIGNWKKTGTKNGMPVRLYKTNPALKSFARIPKTDALIMGDGKTLKTDMAGNGEPGITPDKLELTYAANGLLSTKYSYMYEDGAHPWGGVNYRVFNLKTSKQIDLLQELDPLKLELFLKAANEKALVSIQQHKSNSGFSEDEWINELGGAEQYKQAFENPSLNKQDCSTFMVDANGIHVIKSSYFGLSTTMMALDLDLDLVFTFAEIKNYLKKDSVLNL